MTRKMILIVALIFGLASLTALADNSNPKHPCKTVKQACESAGFAKGQWKKGAGLWRDCINPIMQGQTTVNGATKALPSVDPSVVQACKAKHPKFGHGKVGS